MKLSVLRHLWGLEGALPDVLPRVVAAGYVGIEAELPPAEERAAFRAELERHELAFVAEVALEDATEEDQIRSFRAGLEDAKGLDAVGVTAHAGRDCWPLARSIEFYKRLVEIEHEVGVRAAHETHRGRPLFTPWDTLAILEAVPELRLCCDFSHWVVVSERLLEDQRAAVELAARHAAHVHARVGHDQGPQVPDPRAPERARELEAFEGWWRLVWDAQRAAGATESTLTPEYGPPPYLQTLPYTGVPVVDLVEMCDWQAARAHAQFAAWQNGADASA